LQETELKVKLHQGENSQFHYSRVLHPPGPLQRTTRAFVCIGAALFSKRNCGRSTRFCVAGCARIALSKRRFFPRVLVSEPKRTSSRLALEHQANGHKPFVKISSLFHF